MDSCPLCCDNQADLSYPCCSFKICKECKPRVKPQGKCPGCRKWEAGKSDMTDNDGYWWYTPEALPGTEANGHMLSWRGFPIAVLALDAIFRNQAMLPPFGAPPQPDNEVASPHSSFVLPPLDDETMRHFGAIDRQIEALWADPILRRTHFLNEFEYAPPAHEPMTFHRFRWVMQINFEMEEPAHSTHQAFHLTRQERECLGFFAPIPYTNTQSVKDRQKAKRRKCQGNLRRCLRKPKVTKSHFKRMGFSRKR